MGGKMEGFGVVVLLVIVGLFGGVEGRASAQCVQFGQASSHWREWEDRIKGNVSFTIGGKLMRPRHAEVLDYFPFNYDSEVTKEFLALKENEEGFGDLTCEEKAYRLNIFASIVKNNKSRPDAVTHAGVDFCTEKIDIRVYAVQQFGVTLRGWLFIEVVFDGERDRYWDGSRNTKPVAGGKVYPGTAKYLQQGLDDQLEWIYVQVRDESFNAIGEFVSPGEIDEGDMCRPIDSDLIGPTDYQIMPCSATGFREAKTSQALFMAKRRQYQPVDFPDNGWDPSWTKDDIERRLPKKDLKNGIYFLWRLNEYWCNRHEKFRIDVMAFSSKNEDAYIWSRQGRTGDAQCRGTNSAAHAEYYKNNKLIPPENLNFSRLYNDAKAETWKIVGVCRAMEKKTGWFMPKWFGAADIKTPGERLDCSKKIYHVHNQWSGVIPEHSRNWLKESVASVKVREDFIGWRGYMLKEGEVIAGGSPTKLYTPPPPNFAGSENMGVVRGCQVNPFVDERLGQPNGFDIVTFGGRCEGFLSKTATHSQYQHCEYKDEEISKQPQYNFNYTTWDTYKNYTEDLKTGRLRACSADCVELNDTHLAELKDIQVEDSVKNQTISQPPVSGKVLMEARRISRETTFWQVRKYHGNLCIFFAMFIMPVSLFITRYYKETFMHGKCASCPPWLWVHLFMCISVLTLFRSTFSAMRETIYAWGRQTDGNSEFHRAVGYAFVGIFGVMVAIGGLRPIPRIPRLATCAIHSVLGFVLYFIALFLIMDSPNIPGSPSQDYCNQEGANNSNRTDPSEITHRVTIYAIVWLVLDIIFHAFLTIFQVITDKRTGIERPGFGLPFIPFLPPNSNRDYQGSFVRKIVLVLYIITSFSMTVLTMADLFDNDLDEDDHKFCKPGNQTTCNVRENPFGCTYLQRQYYNIVINRYNITWDD